MSSISIFMPDEEEIQRFNGFGTIADQDGRMIGAGLKLDYMPLAIIEKLQEYWVRITEGYVTGDLFENPETGETERCCILITRFHPIAADDWRIARLRQLAELIAEPIAPTTWRVETTGFAFQQPEMPIDLDDESEFLSKVIRTDAARSSARAPDPVDDDIAQHGTTVFRTEEWQRDLPMGEKFLYLALLGHCGGKKNWCEVSNDTLAADISADRRSVKRYLYGGNTIGLLARGLVRVTPHRYKNLNRYELPEHRPINFTKSRKFWIERGRERRGR
jgi:hypothetical protein